MSKFIRLSKKISDQDVLQYENFIEQQQLRLDGWRKIDILDALFRSDLSQSINISSIEKIYYGFSKLIIEIQSELLSIQRNLSHVKSLTIMPMSANSEREIEKAFNNVKNHTESYCVKVKQIQTEWNILMNLAINPVGNLFV